MKGILSKVELTETHAILLLYSSTIVLLLTLTKIIRKEKMNCHLVDQNRLLASIFNYGCNFSIGLLLSFRRAGGARKTKSPLTYLLIYLLGSKSIQLLRYFSQDLSTQLQLKSLPLSCILFGVAAILLVWHSNSSVYKACFS
mgnify:CR=1 FL=1